MVSEPFSDNYQKRIHKTKWSQILEKVKKLMPGWEEREKEEDDTWRSERRETCPRVISVNTTMTLSNGKNLPPTIFYVPFLPLLPIKTSVPFFSCALPHITRFFISQFTQHLLTHSFTFIIWFHSSLNPLLYQAFKS